MSKVILSRIAPLHPMRRLPPPRPAPDPKLKELEAKQLEEKEEKMEEALSRMPNWYIFDSATREQMRQAYRLQERNYQEHPPGLQPIRKADLAKLQSEVEEKLRNEVPGWFYMEPSDRKSLITENVWKARGGWGE
jgi:hypothetical protein